MARILKYGEAIAEATVQAMDRNPRAVVMGVGVADAKGVFGTTLAAFKKFGPSRVVETPLSENTLTGVCVGASLHGHRPILVHARNDFLMLTMDQIVNHAAKWRYMSGGRLRVGLVIRCIVGRGWGQAAQHSQSLQAMFAHVPGLKVALPATASDAKGLLIAAVEDDSPVIFIEHRWLYDMSEPVPEEPYTIPLGRATVRREGRDVTIVATSHMVHEALAASETLAKEGVDVEVLDLRTVRPLDEAAILASVGKTGRLVVADTGGKAFGVAAEIAALAVERAFSSLKAPVRRVALPDAPTPCSHILEKAFYPGAPQIAEAVRKVVAGLYDDGRPPQRSVTTTPEAVPFKGPF